MLEVAMRYRTARSAMTLAVMAITSRS